MRKEFFSSCAVEVLTGVFERLRGLKRFDPSCETMVALVPCRDIHTFGMKASIDVAFANERGIVVESYREIAPHRRVRCSNACFVMERYARRDAWYEVGDTVFRSTSAMGASMHTWRNPWDVEEVFYD